MGNFGRILGCGMNKDMHVNIQNAINADKLREKLGFGALAALQLIPIFGVLVSACQHGKSFFKEKKVTVAPQDHLTQQTHDVGSRRFLMKWNLWRFLLFSILL